MHRVTLLALLVLPQAPPVADVTEADHQARIVSAWRDAGIDVETEVRTPTDGRADIVTPGVAWELDWAHKHYSGAGQSLYYAEELDREAGLLLLTDGDDERHIVRSRIICERADIRLVLVPVEGDVPVPGVASDPAPSTTITVFTRANCPPCAAFKSHALPALEEQGWTVEFVTTHTMTVPTFEHRGERWTGYTSAGAFYSRLREAMR